MSTVVLTYIYREFWGTKYFRQSCNRIGLPIHNVWPHGRILNTISDIIKALYSGLVELKSKYKYVIYADAADSFFQKELIVPDGKFIYSTEKNCFPHKEIIPRYTNKTSPWCYLNAGGWCSEIDLAIQYFEKFGLLAHTGNINGQYEHMLSYFQAIAQEFPVELDQDCKYFQTTAFEDPSDFYLEGNLVKNAFTGNIPSILHGNGRTDMTPIYERFK